MPNERSVEVIKAELQQVRSLPVGGGVANIEGRNERLFYLECELARAEGRPEPRWTHKGVL